MELTGVVPPLLTPFTDGEELAEDDLRREVRFALDVGVRGVCVGGSTGDGHTLTDDEVVRVAAVAVDEVAGRVPVVAGIIRNSTRQVVRCGSRLRDEAGVDALQITPVHYLFSSGEDSTVGFYDEIGAAVRLPIVVYNVIPWNTLSPDALLRLDSLEWVVAVKQSGGDIHKLADLVRAVRAERRALRVLSAVDALLYPSFALGAHGTIGALPAVLPAHTVRMWDAVQAGDHAGALTLHEQVLPVWRSLDHPDLPARLRAAVELQGRPVGPARRPISPVGLHVRTEIAAALSAAGVQVEAAA